MLAAFGARKVADVAGAVDIMRAELAAGHGGVRAGFATLSTAAASASASLQVRPSASVEVQVGCWKGCCAKWKPRAYEADASPKTLISGVTPGLLRCTSSRTSVEVASFPGAGRGGGCRGCCGGSCLEKSSAGGRAAVRSAELQHPRCEPLQLLQLWHSVYLEDVRLRILQHTHV